MNISHFPDLLGYTKRARSTSLTKSRLETVSQEAVTGQKADLTKASGGQVGNLHLLQKALDDIKLETRINTLASSRISLLTQGLQGSRTAVNGIDSRAIIALATGSSAAIDPIVSEAGANLKTVMASLSIQHGTRSLFSGDATTTPPFASPDVLLDDIQQILTNAATAADAETALDQYFDDPAGGFNTRIYQGGTSDASSLRLGNNNSVPMEIRGDNDAIKDVLRGLSVMAVSTQSVMDMGSDKFSDIFNSAAASTAKGSTGLIALEADIGIYAANIEKLEQRNQAEVFSINAAYQSIAGRDQFEAATELQLLEVALESSYIITSRLSNLSLVNYLR